jgi:ATP-dependent RNA helicase DDX56/DBP9
MRALRHDGVIHPTKVQAHMKHVPRYLLPKGKVAVVKGDTDAYVPFKMERKGRKKNFKKIAGGKKRSDPLKSFSYKKKA